MGQVQGPLHESWRAYETDRSRAQGGERGVTVVASEFAQPDLLPDDIAEFDQEEVGSKQCVAATQEAFGFVRQRFRYEPFDRHTGVDDEVQRSRSSRRSSTLSVCGVP
jgi:hypothetical protein